MDKKTVLAIGLIVAVIGIWQLAVVPRFAPPPEEAPAPRPAAVAPAPPAAPAPAAPSAGAAEVPPVPAAAAEQVAVARPRTDATLSNASGGTLESWRLKDFLYAGHQKGAGGAAVGGSPMELVRPGPGSAPLSFTFTDPATQAAFAGPWAVTQTESGATFQAGDAHGLRVSRSLLLSPDGYEVEIRVGIENLGDVPRPIGWETAWGPGIDRHLPEKERGDETAHAFAAGSIDTVKAKKVGDRSELGPVSWVSLGNRYFIAALGPREGALGAFVRRTSTEGIEVGLRAAPTTLLPRQSVSYRIQAYLGPKDRARLAAAGSGLEQALDYGWISWLAIPFLHILKFCQGFLRSWGLAIFALTLLVKAALFPISFKMFRSMKKMQEVAPKVQALKAKFKNDPQGLQRATMEIYREHKVNPVAGCLPMLVQIPVFFALYQVLFKAIELRGAGFLYIPDLSLKDPYYVTPLLMGATMLIQQRMTPTAGDPMQARMMMFMPIIFTAMFINFSSGLVLYFLFSNVLSITEQKLFRALSGRGTAPQAGGGAPAENRGKKRRQR